MESLLLLGEILMINLVLSGDNAMVIAMASKDLRRSTGRLRYGGELRELLFCAAC